MYAKLALVSLAVAAAAAPTPSVEQEERSLKAVGTAALGAGVSYLTGQILNRREESLLEEFVPLLQIRITIVLIKNL